MKASPWRLRSLGGSLTVLVEVLTELCNLGRVELQQCQIDCRVRCCCRRVAGSGVLLPEISRGLPTAALIGEVHVM